MSQLNIEPNYLTLAGDLTVAVGKIKVEDIFGLPAKDNDLYFAFEDDFAPYQTMVTGNLPRVDLVTMSESKQTCLKSVEIKLTALPDNQTSWFTEDQFGSEIVVRPDTIVYLALSTALLFRNDRKKLLSYLEPCFTGITSLEEIEVGLSVVGSVAHAIDKLLVDHLASQSSFLMQPVWKTEGKQLILNANCFDIFVWSNFAFTRLFVDVAKNRTNGNGITRHTRSLIWYAKMLYDFASTGTIDHKRIIDTITYNTRNDKAFACGGQVTHVYMRSKELVKPRVKREAVKEMILGGGEKYLSPERRLDAAIVSTPGLFSGIAK